MMTAQPRQTKVLAALLVSIVAGAIILNALGHNPPSAGGFCLSRYNRLAPVEKSVVCRAAQYPGRWKQIEIYYSGSGPDSQATYGSNKGIEQLSSLSSVAGREDINCHFIICNGYIGYDGQIQPTDKWQRQWSVNRQSQNHIRPATENPQTIFICIITNGKSTRPTDFQIKRTEALVLELCRRFAIQSESILYPNNWR
jgi:hypothetical protein